MKESNVMYGRSKSTLLRKISYWKKRIAECVFEPIKEDWRKHLATLEKSYEEE